MIGFLTTTRTLLAVLMGLSVLLALSASSTNADSGPGVRTKSRPALKVRQRTYEELTPQEWAASTNAAWFKVEPNRNVPAEKWPSPYCIKWDDACTRCTRDRATEQPICAPIDPSVDAGSCERKLIACQSVDSHAFMTICSDTFGVSWRVSQTKNTATICDYSNVVDKNRGNLRKTVYFECQGVMDNVLKNRIRQENIQSLPGYHMQDNGILDLAFDGTRPRRGQPDIWCSSPQRYGGGWVIDLWRPGF